MQLQCSAGTDPIRFKQLCVKKKNSLAPTLTGIVSCQLAPSLRVESHSKVSPFEGIFDLWQSRIA